METPNSYGPYSQLTLSSTAEDIHDWRSRVAKWLESVEHRTAVRFVDGRNTAGGLALTENGIHAQFEDCDFLIFTNEIGDIRFTHGNLSTEQVIRVFKLFAESLASNE